MHKVCGKTLTETEEFTMIANALLFTIVIFLGYGFWLLDYELKRNLNRDLALLLSLIHI